MLSCYRGLFGSFVVLVLCRIRSFVQYMRDPLLAGLRDDSSYVRRNAVVGCIKLFRLAPDVFEGKETGNNKTIQKNCFKVVVFIRGKDYILLI